MNRVEKFGLTLVILFGPVWINFLFSGVRESPRMFVVQTLFFLGFALFILEGNDE